MKQKYVLTAVAVVAVGAVALGTAPMWEGTNSVKQEETRTSIIEDPVQNIQLLVFLSHVLLIPSA